MQWNGNCTTWMLKFHSVIPFVLTASAKANFLNWIKKIKIQQNFQIWRSFFFIWRQSFTWQPLMARGGLVSKSVGRFRRKHGKVFTNYESWNSQLCRCLFFCHKLEGVVIAKRWWRGYFSRGKGEMFPEYLSQHLPYTLPLPPSIQVCDRYWSVFDIFSFLGKDEKRKKA